MARESARRAQGKGGLGEGAVSHHGAAQKTPAPLKRVIVLADAAEDIETARDFYEAQETGVGEYCVDSLLSDIESLGLFSEFIPCILEFIACWRGVFHSPFIIDSTATRHRFSPCSICDAIQIGFAKN
jgi:hypothetical protein